MLNLLKNRLLLQKPPMTYERRIKELFGASIIEYWPLNETSGTTAVGRINGRHGVYSGDVTLGAVASPVEGLAPTFGGTNGKVNIYSASLASAFNGAEGSMFIWANILTAAITDSAAHYIWQMKVDDNNSITLSKATPAAGEIWNFYKAGGTTETLTVGGVADGWILYGITWSKTNDRARIYTNSYQPAAGTTALGTWAGALDSTICTIGSFATNFYWKGNLSGALLLNREATPEEVTKLGLYANKKLTVLSVLGDSIVDSLTDWPYWLGRSYLSGETTVINHGGGGEFITVHMPIQSAEAFADNADIIIIALGTNDDNAGNMTTLQADYEAGIVALKASNPKARIFGMNVLKRWTDVGGGTEVDKSNIRTAIAAACTAQGITCWDTYTSSWIVVADTSDGLHPTVAGSVKIAAAIAALL